MRPSRHFELGPELVAHQFMRGIIGERNAHGLLDPLADRVVGREALGVSQALAEEGELIGG